MLKHLQAEAEVSLKGALFSTYLMGAWVNRTFVLPRRSESRLFLLLLISDRSAELHFTIARLFMLCSPCQGRAQ